MTRITEKINEIEKFLSELNEIIPSEFKEYASSLEKKAACERYFEKLVESSVDLAFLIIKSNNFEVPEDDIDAFSVLEKNDIIKPEVSEKLKDAKRMRNIIVHQYTKINDNIVFGAIQKEIDKDIRKFIKEVKKWLR